MKQVDTILSCSCVDAILLRKHAYTEILWCSSLGGSKESRISKFVTGKTKHRPPNFEQQSSSITVAVGPGSSCKSPMRSICVHRDSRRTAVVLEAGTVQSYEPWRTAVGVPAHGGDAVDSECAAPCRARHAKRLLELPSPRRGRNRPEQPASILQVARRGRQVVFLFFL